MLRRTLASWKQTSHPPKRTIPLELNPFTRWSRYLPRWSELPRNKPHLDQLTVGLEGCHSAFNATNSIRTCLFFGTKEPPTFLTLASWREIARAQARPASLPTEDLKSEAENQASTCGGSCDAQVDEAVASEDDQWNRVAAFGEQHFLAECNTENPVVALEVFTSRSESLLTRRFPFRCRLVVGHENNGVSAKYVYGADGERADKQAAEGVSAPKAECVVYIPQFGTISSINVVTSMGIALFYAFLDEHFPQSRVLATPLVVNAEASRRNSPHAEVIRKYQASFQKPIPTGAPGEMSVSEKALKDPEGNRCPRLDPRPLHPSYFKKDAAEIKVAHQAFRESLLAYSNETLQDSQSRQGKPPVTRTRFGLSVLYENEYDQRNFGGLVRNANAFLVDKVCYVGRRRYNVVGAVGSNNYTPPVYLGKAFEDNAAAAADEDEEDGGADDQSEEGDAAAAEYEAMIRNVIQEQGAAASKSGAKLSEHQERIIKLSLWSLHMRGKVEKACGGRARFWFLDCGHRNLYAEDFGLLRQMQKDGLSMSPDDAKYKSSLESLIWYMTHCSEEDFNLSLCDTEEKLFDAAGDGVVLLVPQEGKLPHISLLMQCEKILTVLPDDVAKAGGEADVLTMRGLPSQVASGIALQRLSSVLHPGLSAVL